MAKRIVLVIFLAILMMFTQTAFASDKYRWQTPKNLSVYIPPATILQTNMIKEAFNEWSRKTRDRVIFYYTNNPQKANIEIIFKDKVDNCSSDRAIGCTQLTGYPNTGIITQAIIYVANSTQKDNRPLKKNEIYTMMLHEIGHAIGLTEHSTEKLSIMYPSEDDRQEIRPYDIERLNRLYKW